MDLIGRLEPLIFWIERQENPIIILGHQAVLRCISAYFFGIDLNKIPYLEIPLNTIIKMIPETYSFKEEYITVDTKTGEYKSSMQARKKYSIDEDGSRKYK
jgi:broad specificity phosphatase PhoE